jgi:hypothetical protein
VSEPAGAGTRDGHGRERRDVPQGGDRVTWRSARLAAVGTVERKITADTEAAGRTVRASEDEPQYDGRSAGPGAPLRTSPLL